MRARRWQWGPGRSSCPRKALQMEMVILVENTAARKGLLAEHGLSVHLRGGGREFLFDTSASPQALSANASALGIDLAAVEAVIISHGHLDHTGGLPAVLSARPGLAVYAHPMAFARRWAAPPGKPRREIGWQTTPADLARQGGRFVPVEAPCRLGDELLIAGPIPGPQPALDHFLVQDGQQVVTDTFRDELFLMIRGRAGWTVLTGCCHRGLPNTLRLARELIGDDPINMVLGGFHLGQAGPEELAEAAAALAEANPNVVYACHCTGRTGREYLAGQLPGRVLSLGGGVRFEL